jgi:ribonuclease-3
LVYKDIKKEGTANLPTFTISVILEGIVLGTGKGRSKKEASQAAAKDALSKVAKK